MDICIRIISVYIVSHMFTIVTITCGIKILVYIANMAISARVP